MADDPFKTHQLDGPSEGDEPQTQVPEENPLVHGPAHSYDPHSEKSPNEIAAEEEAPAEKPKRKPAPSKAKSNDTKTEKEND